MSPHEPAAGTASPEARDAVHGSSVASPGTDLAAWPLERTVLGLASYALVAGGLTLVGWFTNVPRFTDWLASGISMLPNTALAALCCGAALILATRKRRWSAPVAASLGGIVLILGAATLLQHLARIDLGIDTILLDPAWGNSAAAAPGRMGPPASISNVLIGLALILISTGRARARRFVPALGISAGAIATFALMGYAFGADPLFAIARFTDIAMQTASVLLALAVGVVASVPEYEPVRTIRRNSAAGTLARRSLPFVAGIPFVLGWLRAHGELAGWFDTPTGTALLTLALVTIFGALLWWWVGAVAKYENALRNSQIAESSRRAQLETLIDRAPLGVYLVDAEFRIAHVNPIALPVFGDMAGMVIGRDFDEVIHSLWETAYADEVVGIFRHTLETGDSYVTAERAQYRIDLKKTEYYEWRLDRITLPDGRNGLVCYFRDISHQVEVRKKIEQSRDALRASETRLRQRAAELQAVLDTSPIGLAICEDEQGHSIRGNPANERLLGVPRGGEISLHDPALVPYRIQRDGKEVPVDALPMQRACRGEAIDGEVLDVVRGDGTTVTLYCSAAPLLDEVGKPRGAVGAVLDLTPLKRAEAAMRESEERLAALIDSAMDAVIAVDASQQIVMFNPAAERMFACTAAEALGGSLDRFIPSRFRDQHRNHVREFGKTGATSRRMGALGTLSARRIDGKEFPIEASISHMDVNRQKIFTVILRDITERKRTEERLSALAAIVEFSQDPILSKSLDGIVTSWNSAAEKFFGYSAAEIIGQPVYLIIPRDRLAEEKELLGILRAGHSVVHRETVRMTKAGKHIAVSIAISPIKNASGEIVGASTIVQDVTELKRAEQERTRVLESEREARGEAEQAGRIKDEFLATLSHELRTPLNAILGWSRLIGIHPTDLNIVRDGAQVITRNVQSQADLIADLLDMSRIVSGKLRLDVSDVHLSEVVIAAIDAVRHSAEAKRIRIEPMIDSLSDVVRGDAGRLQQVVWNLLSNAVKFTPRDGRIEVSVAEKSSHVELSVSDSGTGIRPEFLPHVFERFRQADASPSRQHGGLGLGLAIVKQLVEMHGGTVHAESQGEGKGATFTVQLPLASMYATDPARAGAPLKPHLFAYGDVDLDGVRVLAIDDHADTRELVGRLLEERHAEVILACSAEEGLRAIHAHRPDVVLCDIGMPGMDGYRFIREMHAQGVNLPALAVTAFARPEDRTRALRAGYQGHISKPLEPAELIATVAACLNARGIPDGRGRQKPSGLTPLQ